MSEVRIFLGAQGKRPHHRGLADELGEDERIELAEELWERLPDALSPEWETELRQRVGVMGAAEARGERRRIALSYRKQRPAYEARFSGRVREG